MDKWVRQLKDERGGIVPKATQTSPIYPYLSTYLTLHQKTPLASLLVLLFVSYIQLSFY